MSVPFWEWEVLGRCRSESEPSKPWIQGARRCRAFDGEPHSFKSVGEPPKFLRATRAWRAATASRPATSVPCHVYSTKERGRAPGVIIFWEQTSRPELIE